MKLKGFVKWEVYVKLKDGDTLKEYPANTEMACLPPGEPPTQICYLETPVNLDQSFSICLKDPKGAWKERDVDVKVSIDGRELQNKLRQKADIGGSQWSHSFALVDGKLIQSELRFAQLVTKEDDSLLQDSMTRFADLSIIRMRFFPGVSGTSYKGYPRITVDAIGHVPERMKKATHDRTIASGPSKDAGQTRFYHWTADEPEEPASVVLVKYLSREMLMARGILEPDRVIPDPPSNKGEKRKRGGSDSEELHQQFKKLQAEVDRLKRQIPKKGNTSSKKSAPKDVVDLTSE